jgi:hypothetical protein
MSEEEFEESFNTELPWLRIAGVIIVVVAVIVAVMVVSTAVTSLVDEQYIPPEIEEGLTMEERDCISLNLIRHNMRLGPITQDECDNVYIKLDEAGFVPTAAPEFQSVLDE